MPLQKLQQKISRDSGIHSTDRGIFDEFPPSRFQIQTNTYHEPSLVMHAATVPEFSLIEDQARSWESEIFVNNR